MALRIKSHLIISCLIPWPGRLRSRSTWIDVSKKVYLGYSDDVIVTQIPPLHDRFALHCGPQDFTSVSIKLNHIVSFVDGFFKLPYIFALLSPFLYVGPFY